MRRAYSRQEGILGGVVELSERRVQFRHHKVASAKPTWLSVLMGVRTCSGLLDICRLHSCRALPYSSIRHPRQYAAPPPA